MKRLFYFPIVMIAWCALIFAHCGTSSAALLFDQSSPLIGSAISSGTYFPDWAADDFQLTMESNITSFWWVGSSSSTTDNLTGFNIKIYDNTTDRPGSELYSQSVNLLSVTESPTSDSGYSSYQVGLPSFTASAGSTYWLSIQGNTGIYDWENPINPQPWYGWHFVNTNNGNRPTLNGVPFIYTEYDLAFKLEGSPVPLPASIYLLGAGLAALSGFRRMQGRPK